MGDIIKEGYKATITDEEGTVMDTIQLGGYNLDKPMARSNLVDNIKDALPKEAFDDPPEEGMEDKAIIRIAEIFLKPTSPKEGPPVPSSWDISWPGFMKRGIDRLIKEPPWVTIPKYGLKEELRREFEVVTGRKIID